MSYNLESISHVLNHMVRAHFDSIDVPRVRAQRTLDEFVQRFDEACARLVRQDDGDWARAFERLSLVQHVGLSRGEAFKCVGALMYGKLFDEGALEPLQLWRSDWRRVLHDVARVPGKDVDALACAHIESLWEAALC